MTFDLRCANKEITPWGGMALMKRMLDYMEFSTALTNASLPQPSNNRSYAPTPLVAHFMLGVWSRDI